MATTWSDEKFSRPTISFMETLMKGAQGMYREKDEYTPFLFRALVLGVDIIGGGLENPDGESQGLKQVVSTLYGVVHEYSLEDEGKINVGPKNPMNSVKARIISNNMDSLVSDLNLRVYWPMFPTPDMPSPGEIVYVVFEDHELNHGLWLSRVPLDGDFEVPNQILWVGDPETGKEKTWTPGAITTAGAVMKTWSTSPTDKDPFFLTRKFIKL